MEKIACFSGHRQIIKSEYDSVYKATLSYVRELIYEGYTIFRCGGALGFDMMAADIVLSLKEEFPDIKLHIYVPCLDQNKNYPEDQKKRYLEQINRADRILCISERYYSGCMHDRNRAMVRGSRAIINYQRKQSGGTAFTVRFAEKNGLRIISV